jgi:hypothetical protein
MNKKILRALVEAGAVKKIDIVANGALFHVEANTPNGAVTAETQNGKIRTWVTLDAAAKWVRSLGIGSANIKIANWQPGQREIGF